MHVTKVSLSLILCIEVYINAHLSAASRYRTINLEIILDPAFIINGCSTQNSLTVAVFPLNRLRADAQLQFLNKPRTFITLMMITRFERLLVNVV